MSLLAIAEEYDNLPPGEQGQFNRALHHLFGEGFLWRGGDEEEHRLYHFLLRRQSLVAGYLALTGWELRHHERLSLFHLLHAEGRHRRRLNRDTTIWLLLLRLLYAEQRESTSVSLTRHPTTTVGELFQRYADYFPGQSVRKKTSLDTALRTLQSLRLIQAAEGGRLRATHTDQLIELLPVLEVIVPANAIAEIAERLGDFQRGGDGEDGEDSED